MEYIRDNELTQEIFEVLKREDRVKEKLYVTDLGKCKRKLWYEFKGADKKHFKDTELFMFSLADNVHGFLISILKDTENFDVLEVEYDLSDLFEEDIKGRADAIVLNKKTNEVFIVDFKSSRNFHTNSVFPRKKDVLQVQAYLYAMNNSPKYKINRGKLWYVDRSGSNTPIEIWVEPNKEIKQIIQEHLTVKDLEKEPDFLQKELAMRKRGKEIYLVPSWECKYCSYAGISCYQDLDEYRVAVIEKEKLKVIDRYDKIKQEIIKFYETYKKGVEKNE